MLNVAQTQTQRRGYHEKVIDHYENPRNVRTTLSLAGTI